MQVYSMHFDKNLWVCIHFCPIFLKKDIMIGIITTDDVKIYVIYGRDWCKYSYYVCILMIVVCVCV